MVEANSDRAEDLEFSQTRQRHSRFPAFLGKKKVARCAFISTVAQALFLILLGMFPRASAAQTRNWRIADFKDTIAISEEGTARVSEKITFVFVGPWHGIHRTIPIEYPGPRGTNYTLYLDVRSVTDEAGTALKYDSSKSGADRDLKIYIPGAEDATRVVNIEYEVRNGVRYFDSHDEFYWNVTGNDWPVPIDHVSASVTTPQKAAGGLRAQAFTGVYGSTEGEATSEVKGAIVTFETTNPLPMRGGMTIDIYIPKGILDQPGWFTKLAWFLGSNPIVFLPLLTLAVMFSLWHTVGKDPDPGLSVAPQYEPPKGMTPRLHQDRRDRRHNSGRVQEQRLPSPPAEITRTMGR